MKRTEFSGAYISDCAVAETPDYAHSLALAARLWVLSEEIVGEISNSDSSKFSIVHHEE